MGRQGAPRSSPAPVLAATQQNRVAAPAAVVEFAMEQVLRNDTLDALPAVLERLVTAFSGRCALAFQPGAGQPGAGQPLVVLAAHPASAADDQVLLSQVGALSPAPDGAAGRGSIQAPLESGAPGASVLLAWSAPVGGHCLCAIALVGDASHWNTETRAVLSAVATAVAAQIRHASDAADLAGQQALAEILITGSPDPIIATDSAPAARGLQPRGRGTLRLPPRRRAGPGDDGPADPRTGTGRVRRAHRAVPGHGGPGASTPAGYGCRCCARTARNAPSS